MFDILKGKEITVDLIRSLVANREVYAFIADDIAQEPVCERRFYPSHSETELEEHGDTLNEANDFEDDFVDEEEETLVCELVEEHEEDVFEIRSGKSKPFFDHRVESSEIGSSEFECFGITGSCAYLFKDGKHAILDLESEELTMSIQNGSASMVVLHDTMSVFSTNDGLYSECFYSFPLRRATKMAADPLCNSRFFFYSKETKWLNAVEFHNGSFHDRLVKSEIDGFDVSRRNIMYVMNGVASVFRREDTAISPVFARTIRKGAVPYVDDDFCYEFVSDEHCLFIWSIGHGPVQCVHSVANVFKSSEIAIQYLDGAVAAVGKKPLSYDYAPVAVAYDGTRMVSWFSFEEKPAVETLALQLKSSGIDATIDVVFAKIVDALTSQKASAILSAKKVVDKYEHELDEISSQVENILSTVPQYATQQCVNMYDDGRVSDAFATAAKQDIGVFAAMCDDGRLQSAIDNSELSDDSVCAVLVPLTALLHSDASKYAPLVLNALLALNGENQHPSDNNTATIRALQRVVNDLIPIAQSFPSLAHTLRLISQVATSITSE